MPKETQQAPPPAPAPVAEQMTPEDRLARLEVAKFNQEKSLSLPMQSYFKGIAPSDPLNKMMAFCEGIVGSKFITEEARNDIASIFFLVNISNDLELKWTHGLRCLFMTPGGKVGMEGSIMLALLLSKKFKVKILRSDPDGAEYWIKRPGGADEFEWSQLVTYTEAEERGWPMGRSGIKAPWKDRANMLRWRSLASVARVVAADVLGGIYLPDELEAIDLEQNGQGTYTSAREKSEAEADKKAEADPNLEVVVGPKRGRRKPKPEEKTGEKEPFDIKPDLSPQEARNEAFLANQAKKEEPKPASAVVPPTESKSAVEAAPDPEKVAIRARMEEIRKQISPGYGLADVSQIIHAFYGDAGAKNTKQITIALDNIEEALKTKARDSFISIAKEDARAAGKNLRTALDAMPVEIEHATPTEEPEPAKPGIPSDFIPGLSWGDATVLLAREAIAKHKINETRFVATMRTYDIHEMPEGEAAIWLLMYYFTKDAVMLTKRAKTQGKTAADALDLVEGELKAQLTKETSPIPAERAIMNAITEWS